MTEWDFGSEYGSVCNEYPESKVDLKVDHVSYPEEITNCIGMYLPIGFHLSSNMMLMMMIIIIFSFSFLTLNC